MRKSNIETFDVDGKKFGIIIKNSPREASRLNKLLKHYPKTSQFKEHDEPVFFVPYSTSYINIEIELKLPTGTILELTRMPCVKLSGSVCG